jgi:predicted ester cyclase
VTEVDVRTLFLRSVDAFNACSDDYLGCFARDAALHNVPPPLPPTPEGARLFYEALWRAFPDGCWEIVDLVVEGERMACRYRWSGTHLEDFDCGGVFLWRATGKRIEIEKAMSFLHWRDGKCIAEWGIQGDDLFQQLEDAVDT